MSSTYSYTWHILAEYNNRTKKVEGEWCKKSYNNLVKYIRIKFSIDKGQQFEIKIHDAVQNKYFKINKNEIKNIPEGARIRVINVNETNTKPANSKEAIANYTRNRQKWKVNSKVEIYSDTQRKWLGGNISHIFTDAEGEWLVVRYGKRNTKEIQRLNKYIRPIQKRKQKQNDKANQRKDIIQHTINKIKQAATTQNASLMLLSTMKSISNKPCYNDTYDAYFTITLDLLHKEWMLKEAEYNSLFKQEMCIVLDGMDSSKIKIEQVREGSVIVVVKLLDYFLDHIIKKIIPVNKRHIYAEHVIAAAKVQDQIEVQFKKQWYPATIIEISTQSGVTGKYFHVRYNPLKGKNRFYWNTEWLHIPTERDRVHFPGQLIDDEEWNPIGIAVDEQGVRASNVNELHVGHHIFVQYNDYWWRCEVVKKHSLPDGIAIIVMGLHYGGSSRLRLRLWKQEDVNLIRLRDMMTQRLECDV